MLSQLLKLVHGRKDRKGFTLVELMIVIVVIGILVAIAVPRFGTAKSKANLAACKSNLRNIQTALATYYAEHDAYPAATDFTAETLAETLGVNVQMLKCPEDGDPYVYSLDANGKYEVTCPNHPLKLTEDGIANTTP